MASGAAPAACPGASPGSIAWSGDGQGRRQLRAAWPAVIAERAAAEGWCECESRRETGRRNRSDGLFVETTPCATGKGGEFDVLKAARCVTDVTKFGL